MNQFYIDFHTAVHNRMVVGSDWKHNQFITWDGDSCYWVYQFSDNQSVQQVDMFKVKTAHSYDAMQHAKQYYVDLKHLREVA